MNSAKKYFGAFILCIVALLSGSEMQFLGAQCADYTVTPSQDPVGGVFVAGTIVEYCIDITKWEAPDALYLHGVQPINLGNGWLPLNASSGTSGSAPCSTVTAGGGWFWTDHKDLGWGWYFETVKLPTPVDNDPSNNDGDANPASIGLDNCMWSFCFQLEASSSGAEGESLAVEIDIYSDAESGDWQNPAACLSDPPYVAPPAILTLCHNPSFIVSTDAADGFMDICTATSFDIGAEVDVDPSSYPAGATQINYYWEGPGGTWTSNEENPTVPNPNPGRYELVVEVDGCESIPPFEVVVGFIAAPVLDWNPNPICRDEDPILLEPILGSDMGGVWSGEGVSDLGNGTASFDPAVVSAAFTDVTYELPTAACDAKNTQAINILEVAGLPTFDVPMPICAGETVLPDLVAMPDIAANSVSWFSDAALGLTDLIDESNSISFPSFIDVNTPGSYKVWLVGTNSVGCFSEAVEMPIEIVDCSCPALITTLETQTVCDGQELTVPIDLQGPELGTLTWTYPDGSTDDTDVNAVHTFTLDSDPCGETQTVSYEIFCTNTGVIEETGSFEVTVFPDLSDDSVVIEQVEADGCPIIRVSKSCDDFEISLDAGDGPLGSLEYQILNEEEGTLYITVSQSGADDLCVSHEIPYDFVCEDPLVKIPSAFSPNFDDINDCFQLLGAELTQVEMNIFNRWGDVVFTSKDPTFCWVGSINGEEQPSGIYVYHTSFTYADGREDSMSGIVTLTR